MKKKLRALMERVFPARFQLNTVISELHELRAILTSVLVQSKVQMELQFPEQAERYWDKKRLLRYGFKVNSQNDEDGMVHEIFRRIGHTSRVFVELGVGNGLENNTAFLLATGWTGFWIDGSSAFQAALAARPEFQEPVLRTHVDYVSKENIEDIFARLDVPAEFDFLSLDIDQNTYHVWGALGKHRPRVVVVEYNPALPPDIFWTTHYDATRIWDGSCNFGGSLKAFEEMGRSLGYSLVGCDLCGVNAFFVRSDLVGEHFCAPYTSENHYQPSRHLLSFGSGHKQSFLDRNPSGRDAVS